MPLNHSSSYAELTDYQSSIIGKFLLEFTNIEYLLCVLLSRLLLTPEYLARTYTEHMTIYSVIEKIKNAIKLHDERYSFSIISKEHCEIIKEKINKISIFRKQRNQFSHYCWCRIDDSTVYGTAFSGVIPNLKRNKEDDLLINNKKIESIYSQAFQLVEELNDLLLMLPEIEEAEVIKIKRLKK